MRRAVLLLAIGMSLVTNVHAAEYVAQSGKELFGRFCSSCHGTEGRGDGPVSGFFKQAVPDLTMIAQRNGGKFPYERIERIIDGRHTIGAHGSRTMPVWGEEFARTERGNPEAEQVSRIIIERLVDHLWNIQRPLDKAKPQSHRVGPDNIDPAPDQK